MFARVLDFFKSWLNKLSYNVITEVSSDSNALFPSRGRAQTERARVPDPGVLEGRRREGSGAMVACQGS